MEANKLQKSFESYRDKLNQRSGVANRVYSNMMNLRSLSDEQLRIKLLNGKLEEILQKKCFDRPPCNSMAQEIYQGYFTLRQKGEYPEVSFYERIVEIIDFAESRVDASGEKCSNNYEREHELYEKFQNIGSISKDEKLELVRFEQDSRTANQMINDFITVGNKLLGDRRINNFKDLLEIKELPIVKAYERRLTESEHKYFMSTSTEEILDDIILEASAESLAKTKDCFHHEFGKYGWIDPPSLTVSQAVAKEISSWERSRLQGED